VIEVRPGRKEDQSAISAFATDTFSWGDYVALAFLEWLEEEQTEVLVAVDDNDQPVAVVRVRLLSEQEGWISGARVAPTHRRQGVGSLLNDAARSWLSQRGALVARLTAEENNEAARSQVTKLGFRPVAQFIHGHKSFSQLGSEANGGRRLPAPERFDLAPTAEAEPAFIVFSSGELARVSHGLYAFEGWDFRRLSHTDLANAARRRELWTSPSGWAMTRFEDQELWVNLVVTNPSDAPAALRALVDLAHEHNVTAMHLMIPRIGWLEDALAGEHVELSHANVVYERALS
jgi:ribosomal protein S18 acetylase RimI-like enzyme